MDGSTMLQWTARDGQLGNGRLGNGVMMDGSQHVAAFLLQIFQECLGQRRWQEILWTNFKEA
jgi:hypothetical protein